MINENTAPPGPEKPGEDMMKELAELEAQLTQPSGELSEAKARLNDASAAVAAAEANLAAAAEDDGMESAARLLKRRRVAMEKFELELIALNRASAIHDRIVADKAGRLRQLGVELCARVLEERERRGTAVRAALVDLMGAGVSRLPSTIHEQADWVVCLGRPLWERLRAGEANPTDQIALLSTALAALSQPAPRILAR